MQNPHTETTAAIEKGSTGRARKANVPICQKATLTIEEASAYTGIGVNKLRELSNDPRCPFVLYVGKRHLIKREKFEDFLDKSIEL